MTFDGCDSDCSTVQCTAVGVVFRCRTSVRQIILTTVQMCTVQYSTAAEDLIEGHEATRDDTTRTIRYPLT